MFSDTHGQTWNYSRSLILPGDEVSNPALLSNGSLVLNVRGHDLRKYDGGDPNKAMRWLARSDDQGDTWPSDRSHLRSRWHCTLVQNVSTYLSITPPLIASHPQAAVERVLTAADALRGRLLRRHGAAAARSGDAGTPLGGRSARYAGDGGHSPRGLESWHWRPVGLPRAPVHRQREQLGVSGRGVPRLSLVLGSASY